MRSHGLETIIFKDKNRCVNKPFTLNGSRAVTSSINMPVFAFKGDGMNRDLSYEEIHRLLCYDKETGIFTNKVNRGNVKRGATAGSYNKRIGYCRIRINGDSYYTHRLAWFYIYGYFPENQIDHINQIKTDNRIDNLREATQSCNMKNNRIKSNNVSGITGVSWENRRSKWLVQVRNKDNKCVHVGYFISRLDAAKARYKAELENNYGCQTRSAALEYIKKHDLSEVINA